MPLPDCITADANCSWRILVLENHPPQRQDQIETLRHWGYQVFIAEAPPEAEDVYQGLKIDAIKKARDHDCDIALIDLRLINDDDTKDTSGIELINELTNEFPSLHLIILSGYKLPSALSPTTVHWYYIGKEEGPKKLKIAIENIVKQICATRATLGA